MIMQGLHYDLDSLFPENPDFLQEEEICLRDYENLKRLYPKQMRLIAVILEEYLDRYEYEGSPMYHEYPDEVTIYRMAKDIMEMMNPQGDKEELNRMLDLIQVMICQEMYVRRRRHDRFCERFAHRPIPVPRSGRQHNPRG